MLHFEAGFDDGALEKYVATIEHGLFPTERELVQQLHSLAMEGYARDWTRRKWTAHVKKCLSDLGRARGFLTYPRYENGRSANGNGEWMLDVVWVDAKHDLSGGFDWRYTRGVNLACECEWETGEEFILEDFYKLTFVVADHRLFIYTNPMPAAGHKGGQHPVDLCKRACPVSRGFRYLTVGVPDSRKGRFRVDAWVA